MVSEEQEQCGQATRPPMAMSPSKHGDEVAVCGKSHLWGRVPWAALLEQGWAGWQQKLSALSLRQTSTQTNVSCGNKPVEGIN